MCVFLQKKRATWPFIDVVQLQQVHKHDCNLIPADSHVSDLTAQVYMVESFFIKQPCSGWILNTTQALWFTLRTTPWTSKTPRSPLVPNTVHCPHIKTQLTCKFALLLVDCIGQYLKVASLYFIFSRVVRCTYVYWMWHVTQTQMENVTLHFNKCNINEKQKNWDRFSFFLNI